MTADRQREYQREWARQRRARLVERGLTARGTVPLPRLPADALRASNGMLLADKRAADRRHYRENRERIAAQTAAYRATHAKENRQRAADWRAANPERAACREAQGAASRGFGERVPAAAWDAIWQGPCFSCGATPAKGIDHIVPKSRGGRNVIDNLQPACLPCNLRKGVG